MDRHELFQETNYKIILRKRQKSHVRKHPQLTWRFIAEKIRLQPTYLSRSFNNESVHLNEDHLFEILEFLKFDEVEKEFVSLLRSKDLAASEKRKSHLHKRIEALVKEHYLRTTAVKKEATPQETAFLMNPLLLLIYVSLHVKKYARAPATLERIYGLSATQLENALSELENMDFIRYDRKKRSVPEVRENSMHFAKEHPLMRGHQQILRHLCAARLARVEDAEKVSFLATFSASARAYEKIREAFYQFLSEAQKIAAAGEGERVFQMGFDLFPWD